MNEPLIINFAPTGMVPTREMSPHVPLSATEIIEEVHAAAERGITIAHLHAREPDGSPSHRPELLAEIVTGIRRHAPELVVCLSLSGRMAPALEQRVGPLQLTGAAKPDMGSLTLSSLNFSRQASINTPEVVQGLAAAMQQARVLPELEVFDLGMIQYAKYLAGKGLLRAPFYFNLILGNVASAQLDALHAGLMIRDLPEQSVWAMGGLGGSQWPANQLAMALGGGVRVGLEDSLFFDCARRQLATNADLLRRVKILAELAERPLMSPARFRQQFGLEPGRGTYGLAAAPVAAAGGDV